VTAEAHPSAVSVCLVTPDGQRTMCTYLGAASLFTREHLPPAAMLQNMQLLHCEGYTAYKPGLLEAVAEASKAANATFSLDMASFEVVRNCWSSLRSVIESGHVDVLFCNEDEASEIVKQYGACLVTDLFTSSSCMKHRLCTQLLLFVLAGNPVQAKEKVKQEQEN
jgi:sugar/nucleoside kinase (ribokinase family)